MDLMQNRDANSGIPNQVDAAERAKVTAIIRHEKPAALIIPTGALQSPAPAAGDRRFEEFLLSFPVNLDGVLDEEDRPRVTDVDLEHFSAD